jgi:hypothetical protein
MKNTSSGSLSSRPMTLVKWEKSSMDKKLDVSGVHGKQGLAKNNKIHKGK